MGYPSDDVLLAGGFPNEEKNFDGVSDEEARKRSFLRTYTGKNVFPLEISPEDISIDDIAHALSNQCRFSGHTKFFYSVAHHSVLVANYLWEKTQDTRVALAGLLHDATEAYLVDMPTPIKRLMPEYVLAEARLARTIEEAFNLSPYALSSPNIHEADAVLLMTEARDLMGDPQDWNSLKEMAAKGYAPIDKQIVYRSPTDSKWFFKTNFNFYVKGYKPHEP